jgi:UDPglucose--hexose-1-phosphate uridylyltransferase
VTRRYRRGVPSPATNQLRFNPLTGRWVTIASGRASRPQDFVTRRLAVEESMGRPCPFCPGNEEATPPALETYGPDGEWLVRVVPNLYPAFGGHEPMVVEQSGPLHAHAPASGLHEVLIYAPEHHLNLNSLDDRRMALTMAALRDRVEAHSRHPEVAYTQAIVNYGREAGASLEHPHAQLIGIPFVPGEIDDEYRGIVEHPSECLLCDLVEAEEARHERVVLADDHAVVIAPWWSGAPYEMLVLPRTHEARLPDADPRDVVGTGTVLRDALRRLHHVVGNIAYNVVVHTAPHGARGTYHWHVHVLPRTSTAAGFEQGTGVLINTMAPEDAAAQLRAPDAIASAGR